MVINSIPITSRKPTSIFQPPLAWMSIYGFILVCTILLFVSAGELLRLFFPVASFLVGVFLYWKYPILYLGFTWWLWFLTPWIRRLIDQQAGWQDPNIVLLSPFLVTIISFWTFVRQLPKRNSQSGLLFIPPLMAVVYALLVGLIKGSLSVVAIPFLSWFTPIVFGFHIFSSWRDYPSLRQNTQRVFLWCVLITGFYGVVQFLVAPGWDRYWMENVSINTIGSPEPLMIRVFSTMNSPGPFATVLSASLLLLLNSISPLIIPAYIFGYLSFLLSSARGAWGGWIIGLLCLITNLKAKLQMRLILIISVMMLLVVPLTYAEPFSDVIHTRLESFSNIQSDTSFEERQERYDRIFSVALVQWLGNGMGGNPEAHIDSGVLDMLFTLGWFGTIPYFFSIAVLLIATFQYTEARFDMFMSTSRAIVLSLFAQFSLTSPTIGVGGIIFWGFLGFTLAGHQYYIYQKQRLFRVQGDKPS